MQKTGLLPVCFWIPAGKRRFNFPGHNDKIKIRI